MKFRKKPVVIDAILFTGANLDEVKEFVGPHGVTRNILRWVEIKTLEGSMRANPGDWIIKGVAGEFYPCKPDIFKKTHEPVK